MYVSSSLGVELPCPMVTMFNSLKRYKVLPNVLHRTWNILHSSHQCLQVQFLHILTNICRFPFLKNVAILLGIIWHLIMILIWILLMSNDVEHIFMGLLTMGLLTIFSWAYWEMSIQNLCPPFHWVVELVELWEFFILYNKYISDSQIFSLTFFSLTFLILSLSWWCLSIHKFLILMKANLSFFFFSCCLCFRSHI